LLPFDPEPSVFTVAVENLRIRKYKTIILPVLLYGCETWSLTLREERRVRVFGKRVLRRILGPKRDEAPGEWRKLHNEELHDLYPSPSIISEEDEMGGACSTTRVKRNAYKLLVGKPEGRRPLGRPRRRWLDNIRMNLAEVGWGDVDWLRIGTGVELL
jgi:hypothetical protein